MRVFLVLLLLAGCQPSAPQSIQVLLPKHEIPPHARYQLYAINGAVAWRLNLETGGVQRCTSSEVGLYCLNFESAIER